MTGRVRYLDNGKIKLGINLDIGGAITYFSMSNSEDNIINSYDLGRQIQMSHYSGPNPYEPNGKKPNTVWKDLGWNPVQAGDSYGNKSKVVTFKQTSNSMYIKTIPMQWPLDHEPAECTYESWITLDGVTAHVRNHIRNHRADKMQYHGRDQEIPSIWTNGPWWRLMTYDGSKPFTNEKLTQKPAVMPWKSWLSTENWSALVNDKGLGIGIWHPGVYRTVGGFAGKPGAGSSSDSPTGYIAPIHQEILDYNIDYSYSYRLILGSIPEIRAYVYNHSQPDVHPNWIFKDSRQHWIYRSAVDMGWPIKGELNVDLSHDFPMLVSPECAWFATNNTKLYINAAITSSEPNATVQWERIDSPGFSAAKTVFFPIVGDGKYRVYEVDLSSSPEYTGLITRLQLIPSQKGTIGKRVRVKSIGFTRSTGR